MDIFVRRIPVQATDRQIRDFLQSRLQEFGAHTIACHRLKNHACAIVTVLDPHTAQQFLDAYGQGPACGDRPAEQGFKRLEFLGRVIVCQRSGSRPDEGLLRCLAREEESRNTTRAYSHQNPEETGRTRCPYAIKALSCGVLTYRGPDLGYAPQYVDARQGSIAFERSQIQIKLSSQVADPDATIYITYDAIDKLLVGSYGSPTITVQLWRNPRFYEDRDADLTTVFSGMALTGQSKPSTLKIFRVSRLHPRHDTMCLAYQLTLKDKQQIDDILNLFRNQRKFPFAIPWPLGIITTKRSRETDFRWLQDSLAEADRSGCLPFPILFQCQRLAQNGMLEPHEVIKVVPDLQRLYRAYGLYATVGAVWKLSRRLSAPGPQTQVDDYTLASLRNHSEIYAKESRFKGSMYDLAMRYDHIQLVHRAIVTPTAVYLEGPEPEIKNRVLRKYASNPEHFIRVSFLDENENPLRHEPGVNVDEIFYSHFKYILDNMLSIAGRGFSYLGFSHSSSRSQTCWFMAPFILQGGLVHAQGVIKALGDSSNIRSPAKNAARIGQAFSETNGAITIAKEIVYPMEEKDVERQGRCFTDGVGSGSLELFKKIWTEYQLGHGLSPTGLQIRFAGAKGMIALVTRLAGMQLCLRPSMVKFQAPAALDIEICGAAFKPLPMFLNRQLIKILKDLGVPDQALLDLQTAEVKRLRDITLSPVNAATFLDASLISTATRTPSLIRLLNDIGIDFRSDAFLRDLVEMIALVKLRQIKHRCRIPVSRGVTLYGIADETGYLKEGEIYCVKKSVSGIREVLTGQVTITRAPALHPGDVQVVEAVDVPNDSPLNALRNCCVFSIHGERDLPSMLSGGDLDGDLYNIFWDRTLQPKITYSPADYLRVKPIDLGREVTREDMTDFFLLFMKTDRFGQIATIHLQLADLRDEGTLHPDFLKLAEMHSTAVDFSKTGISCDMSEAPRYPRYKLDFMAPGPRVKVEQKIGILEDEESNADEDEDDESIGAQKKWRFYESNKITGKMYREIDEKNFFGEIQRRAREVERSASMTMTAMDEVYSYVKQETMLISYSHHYQWARDLKNQYEENLADIMWAYRQEHACLAEIEVFSGTILGKDGGIQTKQTREDNIGMKGRFDREASYFVDAILQGHDGHGRREEALERSLACLAVAMEEPGIRINRVGELQSFKYVAAAICLKQIELFHNQPLALRPIRR